MDKSITRLSLMFAALQQSDLVSFNDVKVLKKIMGVYIIYSHQNEILYIGSTNNFFVRFGTDLKHESTHTLVRKLIKAGIHSDRYASSDFLINHYRYKIQVCHDKREAEALEHLAIWMLQPTWNK